MYIYIYVCGFKYVCVDIYIKVFLPPYSERTAYALLNATAVVYIKISFLLLIWSFKGAVDAKIITNSILLQMLLNFKQ